MTQQATPGPGARRILHHPVLGRPPDGEEVQITFDHRPLLARAGEPVVVALLAAGIRVCRTMPGTGEARGPFCLVGRCTDCLMQIDGVPNTRACQTPVHAGMKIATQRGLGQSLGNES